MASKIGTLLLAGAALVTMTGTAFAQGNANSVRNQDGTNTGRYRVGNDGRIRGLDQAYTPEQSDVVQLTGVDGGKAVVQFTMSTKVLPTGGPPNRMQLLCTPGSLAPDPADASKVTFVKDAANERYVTDNDGNEYRNANQPDCTEINGGKHVLCTYGYQPNNDTIRYGKVFDAKCNEIPVTNGQGQVQKQVQLMAKNNDDCAGFQDGDGGLDLISDTAGTTRFVNWYLCNGNGEDDGWAAVTRVQCTSPTADGGCSQYKLQREFDLSMSEEEERSRGRCFVDGADKNTAYCTWTEGNNQPSNRGVMVGAIDLSEDPQAIASGQPKQQDEGRRLWRAYVEKRNGRIYAVRAKATQVAPGKFMYQYNRLERVNGEKGSNMPLMVGLELSRSGITSMTAPADLRPQLKGIDPTHLSVCATEIGEPGATRHAQLYLSGENRGAVVNGTITSVMWDTATKSVVPGRTLGTSGAPYDMHMYSNMYGNNPNTQGRNFARCDGTVSNPFFGQAAGAPLVKSFAVWAITGHDDPTSAIPKNAQYLTFIPTVVASAPAPAPEPTPTPTPDPGTDTGTEDPGTEDPGSDAPGGSAGGCSVQVGGSSSSSFLVLIGLAALAATRRRRSR